MKVIILKSTRTTSQGFLKVGDTAEIDNKTAHRWIHRGIAQEAKNTPTRARRASKPVAPVIQPEPDQTVEAVQSDVQPEQRMVWEEPSRIVNDLDDKSFHELRAMAKERDIEDYGKMTKVELVEHLSDEV